MHTREKRAAFAVMSIATLIAAVVFGSGFTYSQNAHAAPAPQVTGAGQPATAPVVIHNVINEGSVPQATAAELASQPSQNIFRARIGNQQYDAVRAEAKHRSAPEGGAPLAEGRNALVASFATLQSSNSVCPPVGCNPPDMGLAGSSRWVVQGANTSFAVYDTHGNIQPGWPKTFQQFFGVPNPGTCAGNIPFTSDPREFYDSSDGGHFWAAALEVEGAFGVNTCPFTTRYWIAVSKTSNPNGVWNVYAFDMSAGTTNAADFTMIGFDSYAMYFSANMFNQQGTAYSYAEIFGASKWALIHGYPVTAHGFNNITVTGPAGTFLTDTMQPVESVAPYGADSEYFVNSFNGYDPVTNHTCTSAADACQGLAVWNVKAGATSHPSLSFSYVPNTKPYTFAPAADQPSCQQCIDPSDLRISSTPVFDGRYIYAGWETGIYNGTQVVPGIVWSQVAPSGAMRDNHGGGQATQVAGNYLYYGGDDAAIYPAFMPNGRGTVYMVYDHMGAHTYPEVRVTSKPIPSQKYNKGMLLKAGEASYRPSVCGSTAVPVCRWGDYSATSFSGYGSGIVWFGGEYANNSGFRLNWGTWVGGAR